MLIKWDRVFCALAVDYVELQSCHNRYFRKMSRNFFFFFSFWILHRWAMGAHTPLLNEWIFRKTSSTINNNYYYCEVERNRIIIMSGLTTLEMENGNISIEQKKKFKQKKKKKWASNVSARSSKSVRCTKQMETETNVLWFWGCKNKMA